MVKEGVCLASIQRVLQTERGRLREEDSLEYWCFLFLHNPETWQRHLAAIFRYRNRVSTPRGFHGFPPGESYR